jgi:deoxyribose-phosphate aldolase
MKQYLDSTYLKTAEQANKTKKQNLVVVQNHINEAIYEGFKLVMIRPEMVVIAKKMILQANSKLLIGTVIDFPEGNNTLEQKLAEAEIAITNCADELDFVINYQAFKNNEIALVKKEIIACADICLKNKKVVKFIIEVAALTNNEIIRICSLIKNTIISNCKEDCFPNVFVKSSTGFFQTKSNLPNGATASSILLMLENSFPLPVKAAGGIKTYDEAAAMIKLGVKRIGTSSAKDIIHFKSATGNY